MARRATNHRVACALTIMYMETVNYDIRDKLDGDASPVGNVDIGSTSIYGLEAVHDKLLLEGNHHVPLEHNPQRLVLNDSVAYSPWSWGNRVIIARVTNNIVFSIATSDSIASKTNATVSKALPVELPMGITSPTIINRIAGYA